MGKGTPGLHVHSDVDVPVGPTHLYTALYDVPEINSHSVLAGHA